MRPELPPLPASANEEPSELYQVCCPGCCSSAVSLWRGGEGGAGSRNSRDLTSGISGFGHFCHQEEPQQRGRKSYAVARGELEPDASIVLLCYLNSPNVCMFDCKMRATLSA